MVPLRWSCGWGRKWRSCAVGGGNVEGISESNPYHIRNSRGRAALESRRGLNESLSWSIDIDLDESILVWHIATDIYLFWYKEQAKEDPELLAQAEKHSAPEDLACLLWHSGDKLNTRSNTDEGNDTTATGTAGDSSCYKKILDMASQLGAKLIDDNLHASGGAADMLELITQVWVEMLCDASYRYSAYAHAKQLSNGGELITVAALLMENIRRRTSKEF
ncbi:unnamed protein product [Urochloa humidicola]